MTQYRVAVILACYNRKEKTLACLKSLLDYENSAQVTLSVYLLDDASTDGTGQAVKEQFPDVKILQGDGSFFWNGGMRAAFGAALEKGHDFYLWLNDDVTLYKRSIIKLVETWQKLAAQSPEHIIVGAFKDPRTDKLSYSGLIDLSKWHPMKLGLVMPDPERPMPCDTMNGNCVLIPSSVVEKVGNLDKAYTHAMGDLDYGFRAGKEKVKLWVAPGYIGDCERNEVRDFRVMSHSKEGKVSIREHLKALNSPYGLPFWEYAHLIRNRSPLLWPFFTLMPYVKVLTVNRRG